MNMLIQHIQTVAVSPFAWALVALLAFFAAVAAVRWYRCPFLCGTTELGKLDAMTKGEFRPGPRFLITMLAGVTGAIIGLTLVFEGTYPVLSFYLVVLGVFVIQTEPARLQIRESMQRVVNVADGNRETRLAAEARLRSGHLWLVSLHFLIIAAAAAALLSF